MSDVNFLTPKALDADTLPGQLWTGITTALADFGTWLLGAAAGFFSGLEPGIVGAISGLGDWMLTAAAGFFSGLTTAVQNAVTSLTNARTPTANENAASPVSPGQSLLNSMQKGGVIPSGAVVPALLHGPEAVVPLSESIGGTVTPLSSASAGAQGGGNITFYNTFPNATLTSQKDAETLMLKAGYKAVDVMRRAGLLTG